MLSPCPRSASSSQVRLAWVGCQPSTTRKLLGRPCRHVFCGAQPPPCTEPDLTPTRRFFHALPSASHASSAGGHRERRKVPNIPKFGEGGALRATRRGLRLQSGQGCLGPSGQARVRSHLDGLGFNRDLLVTPPTLKARSQKL